MKSAPFAAAAVLPVDTVMPDPAAIWTPAYGLTALAGSKSTRLLPTSPTRMPLAKSIVPLLMSSARLLMPGPVAIPLAFVGAK